VEELVAVVQRQGNVTISPRVLTELISLSARHVPGVARLGVVPHWYVPAVGSKSLSDGGVSVLIESDGVVAHCYLIAAPDTNLLELGIAVQTTVAAAIRELAGLAVREVNVYVQDVEVEHG
jgi:uncharacterized alkaline shock family protein YloU